MTILAPFVGRSHDLLVVEQINSVLKGGNLSVSLCQTPLNPAKEVNRQPSRSL